MTLTRKGERKDVDQRSTEASSLKEVNDLAETLAEGFHLSSPTQNGDKSSKKAIKNPIVWMDLEMTDMKRQYAGLDPDTDHILEIAVLLTDGDLSAPHLEGPDLVIHHSDETLASMNDWCKVNHGKSGLTERSRESKISLSDAEERVMEFLERHTESAAIPGTADQKAHLAGSSIYVDRNFLRKHMPRVHEHLHWRLIDVSSILELARRWYPEEFKQAPRKKAQHTAMADIRESLNELKFYRKSVFKPHPSSGDRKTPSVDRRRQR